MKLWTSAELDLDVSGLFREVRSSINKEINERLTNISLENEYVEWAFIAMIRKDKNWADEIVKRNIKRKELEFKLKIDHQQFLEGDLKKRTNLYLDALQRCIDKMEKFNISVSDRNQLSNILEDIRANL